MTNLKCLLSRIDIRHTESSFPFSLRGLLQITFICMALLLSACDSDDDDSDDDSGSDFSATATYTVNLTGNQEVPSIVTDGSATATVELDENNSLLKATLDVSNVTGVTAAHIHQGTVGINGDVAFAFEDGGNSQWTIAETALSAEQITELKSAGWYINTHTSTNPGGEVRGQIVDSDTQVVTFTAQGEQEVPSVTTTGIGYGYATVNTNTYAIDLKVLTENLDTATAAHIHEGTVGVNGGVAVALEQNADNTAIWQTPDNTVLDNEVTNQLINGGHYVNVHTPANPSGEVRGQILTDNFTLITFSLDGSQEVPAVTTSASGSGYATLSSTNSILDLRVITSGVDDATAAHIHEGNSGNNGGVAVGLEQDATTTGIWQTPENTALDAATIEQLLGGGHYVNIHTPTNPSGEIRGQIQ